MTIFVTIVFGAVYVGMLLGGIPGLRVDRTGVALLGAIVLLAGRGISERAALTSIDVPTLALLFGLMVVSAQFELGGFYGHITKTVAALDAPPAVLLGAVVVLAGSLSAILTNDVVCLAMAPLLATTCMRRDLDPAPFLLALACAANVGSAATIIGNPQNILIGERLDLSFTGYLWQALPPSVMGLAVVWAVVAVVYRGNWHRKFPSPEPTAARLDRYQSAKGIAVMAALIVGFLFTSWPRELLALGGAGLLLLSRAFHSRKIVSLIDWQTLLLFISLFVINRAFQLTGGAEQLVGTLENVGIHLEEPAPMFVSAVFLSNLVSNVPAAMLLLPLARGPESGLLLALASTFAGNLIVVGSVANIVVLAAAKEKGIPISAWTHARIGVPVTVLTLTIAAVWVSLVL